MSEGVVDGGGEAVNASEAKAVKAVAPETVGAGGTNTGCCRRFKYIVELAFFIQVFITAISGVVNSNMLLQRTCRQNLGYNESVCEELVHPTNAYNVTALERVEEEVQSVAAVVLMLKSMLEGFFPALLSPFLGVWSNTHGRKPLIIWPLLGFAITGGLVFLYSKLEMLSPWWYVATSLPYSLSGGSSALFTGGFCYMSDVSSEDNRSYRLAFFEAAVYFGTIVGSLISSYAVLALGTSYLLLLTFCLATANYVYTSFCINESVGGAVTGDLRSIFDISLVKQMLDASFKPRKNYDRAVLLLLVASNCISVFVVFGAGNVDYLYTREKLSWNLKDFSLFNTVHTSVTVVGLIIGVRVLQKLCKLSDAVMTMLAFGSSIAEALARALATAATAWVMYLGTSLTMLRGLPAPLIRSLISKRESPEDVAKVFTLMAVLEAVLPVISPLLYSLLYKYTLATLPSAVYILSMCIYGVCLTMTWYYGHSYGYYLHTY